MSALHDPTPVSCYSETNMATVDRAFARMVAYKRIVTGSVSIACGIGLIVALIVHGNPPPVAAVGLAIFFGGGGWTLRDGLRLRRELSIRPST